MSNELRHTQQEQMVSMPSIDPTQKIVLSQNTIEMMARCLQSAAKRSYEDPKLRQEYEDERNSSDVVIPHTHGKERIV